MPDQDAITAAVLRQNSLKSKFKPTQTIECAEGKTVELDSANSIMCVTSKKVDFAWFYTHGDILQCSVEKDGKTVIESSTSSLLGRALVGGMLAGVGGAILGGATGQKEKKTVVNKISVQFRSFNPIIGQDRVEDLVIFNRLAFNPRFAFRTDGDALAETLHSFLSRLIAPPHQLPQPGTSSAADDLSRLAELHQKGLLTDDEFRKAKSKLLG
ncbi:SHOCT domain-containing protein [Aromatoleum toluclasticum]|uniref:SHOCT domain-containing protein n=1 Tax=Aromatoleum toluclasticum TaxID=92003 RepID=UPI001D187D03|nr:SHOCT domain-containing protein [Aromatoleum toluclasticum]MCC4115288.1 SHOCT domain-containing protein [Aromatoleum toluclasticum]